MTKRTEDSYTKDAFYISLATTYASRSKCVSLKVGCCLVKGDTVLGLGVNGTPKGMPNCCDVYDKGKDDTHHEWSLRHEIHAELNAIIASKCDLNGSTAFITHSPCMNCLKHLIACGIERIVYKERYSKTTDEMLDSMIKYSQGCLKIEKFKEEEM